MLGKVPAVRWDIYMSLQILATRDGTFGNNNFVDDEYLLAHAMNYINFRVQ